MKATTLLAVVLAALVGTLAASVAPNDPDLFWHLTSGAWMLDHQQVLGRDIFSTTMSGAPYSVGQSLGEVIFAAVYRLGGWTAIDLLRGALVGIATFYTARIVLRFQEHPGWAIAPIIATILVSKFLWGDRPQLFSFALFPFFLDTLLAVRLGVHRRLWLLIPVMLVWANLHGGFVAGLAVAAVFVVEAWLTRWRHRRALTLAAGAMVVASLITPSGLAAFSFAASYAGSASAVVEERPTDITSPAGLVFATLLLGALLLALVVDRRAIEARARFPVLWTGLIVSFTVLGLAHQRLLPYAAMTLAPFVAALLPALAGRPVATAPVIARRAGAALVALLLVASVVVAAVGAPRTADLSSYPAGAIDVLRRHSGPVLNEYDWGGYLIFAVPEQPTFIDGRGAALYPPGLIGEFETAVNLRDGYGGVLDRHRIRLVLLRPDRPLVSALREDGWPVLAELAGSWVLLERP